MLTKLQHYKLEPANKHKHLHQAHKDRKCPRSKSQGARTLRVGDAHVVVSDSTLHVVYLKRLTMLQACY